MPGLWKQAAWFFFGNAMENHRSGGSLVADHTFDLRNRWRLPLLKSANETIRGLQAVVNYCLQLAGRTEDSWN